MALKIETLPEFLETDLITTQEFIKRRTLNSQKIFYLIYGKNLDEKLDISKIKDPNNFENTLNSIKKAFLEKKFLLSDILECSYDLFINNLNQFNLSPNNINLLQKIFGPSYNLEYDLSSLSLGEINSYYQLINSLKEKIKMIKREASYDLTYNNRSILSILRCSKEELAIFKNRILDNRKKIRNAFHLAFGSDLKNPANLLILDENQLKDFYEGVELGRNIIINYRGSENPITKNINKYKNKKKKVSKSEYLKDILSCSNEEMQILEEKINLEPSYAILKKYFGDDLDKAFDVSSLTIPEKKKFKQIKEELLFFKKQYHKERKNLLTTIVNAPYEELILVINKIKPDSKRYKILVKAHGKNFNQAKDLTNFSDYDKVIYYDAIAYIRTALKRPKTYSQDLIAVLNCSKEELELSLATKSKSSQQYLILVKAHGENFTQDNRNTLNSKEKIIYNQAIYSLRKKLKDSQIFLKQIFHCTEKSLENALKAIDKESPYYFVLSKAYNNNFLGPKVGVLTTEEEKIYEDAKNYIATILKEQNQNKYLWELVGCTLEELELILPSLPKNWKFLTNLQDVFGTDLKEKQNPNYNYQYISYPLFFLRQRYEKIIIRGSNVSKAMTLTQTLNCQMTELNRLLPYLNKNQLETLKLAYGENLDQVKNLKNISLSNKKNFKYLINRLKNLYQKIIIDNDSGNLYLCDVIGCTIEELQKLLPYLNSTYQIILKQIYGENLDQKRNLTNVDEKMYNIYSAAKKRLKQLYKDIIIDQNYEKYNQNGKNNQYLYETIGCSKEELPMLISLLNKNSASYQLLVKIYGEDFLGIKDLSKLTKSEKSNFGSIKNRLKRFYKNGAKKESYNENKYLWEILKCSKEELRKILTLLNPNTYYYKCLQKEFGPTFDSVCHLSELSENEKVNFNAGLSILRKKIKNVNWKEIEEKEKTYFLTYLTNDSQEILEKCLALIDKDSPTYAILKRVHGSNFDLKANLEDLNTQEKQKYYRAKQIILLNYSKVLIEESKKVNTLSLEESFISNLINCLPSNYQQIIRLYLNNDNNVDIVSNLLNIDKEEVIRNLNIIYKWLNDVIKSYKANFQDELSLSDNVLKQLTKNNLGV